MLTKTDVSNENTLIAELKVKIRLFESDYVDHSTLIEYQTFFGSDFHNEIMIDESVT